MERKRHKNIVFCSETTDEAPRVRFLMCWRGAIFAMVASPIQLETREEKKDKGARWCWQIFIALFGLELLTNRFRTWHQLVWCPVHVGGANLCSARILDF